MKRVLLILSVIFFINSAQAVEFKPLELPKDNAVKDNNLQVKTPEMPKGLLQEDDYELKGRVEFNPEGVLFLDEDVKKMNLKLSKPKKIASKSVLSDGKVLTKIQDMNRQLRPQVDEYSITPKFDSVEYRVGNFSYGTTFANEMDIGQSEYRTKFFGRYDNKYFGIMTALGKDEYTTSGRQMESFYIVPELKLSHGFSIIDAFKINPSYDRYRNEIMLQYSPKINQSRENVNLRAGVSRSYYYKSGDENYQFNFETNFKL